MSLFRAIEAYTDADNRYQLELRYEYGAGAKAARHDPTRNRRTPELNRLYVARCLARDAYDRASASIYAHKRAEAA